MKKFSRLTTQAILIGVLSMMNATPATAQATFALDDLPRTCLPIRGRMLPIKGSTDTDHSKCHCPPLAACNEKINYKGKTYPKLPSGISGVCCPPPVITAPPPSPSPSPSPSPLQASRAPKECEVHYYKNTASGCQGSTFIGTRIAGYCSQYTATSGNALAAKVTSLNTCLKTKCESIKTDIANIDRAAIESTIENSEAREKAHMQAQVRFKDYVTCRRTCFNTNNFNNGVNSSTNTLMQASEIVLNKWIMLDLSDNVTDTDVLSGTNERRKLSSLLGNSTDSAGWRKTAETIKTYTYNNSTLKHFTAKTYGPLVNTTINQREFSNFFNNTYHPDRYPKYNDLSPKFTYRNDIQQIDQDLPTLKSENNDVKNQRDYFFNVMDKIDPKFKDLQPLTNEHSGDYVSPSWSGISCAETTYFGMCMTTFSNDGSCETCLSPETNITMADGTFRLIKDLKMGDSVKAPYGETGIIDEVINIKWPELKLYNINDGQLRLTADHPIMTTNGWRAINYDAKKDDSGYKRYGIATVAQLKIGDVIVTEKGDIAVTRIMPDPVIKDGETFNLKLKDNIKGFYANGILVKSNE